MIPNIFYKDKQLNKYNNETEITPFSKTKKPSLVGKGG
jgi:hypothetical protein